jgi:proteasome accessory factor B
MFERDKDVLRDIGVPIDVVSTDAWDVEHGYTIDKDRYYLPDIAFTPEELSALFVAVRSAGDVSAEEAVRKLLSGADRGILAGLGPPALAGETDPNLSRAAEAVAEGRRVRFAYRTSRGERSDRTVDAFGLAVRGGHWYLVGLDLDRAEIRSFRLSRISDDLEIAGEGSEPPDGFRAVDHVQAGPWGPGDAETTATVAFAPEVAWWATKGIAGADTVRIREDGWVEVRIAWSPGEGLMSWILSFGPDAEVAEPPELRSEILGRLEEILAS